MTGQTVRAGADSSPGGAGRHQPPPRRGGWWHAYVCPVHHVELVAPTDTPDGNEPREHACPHGCRLTGEPYDSAALVYRYQARARHLRLLAHAAADGDGEAAAAAQRLAADLLALHAAAGTGEWHEDAAAWMLRGKLFHQALTEAIWAVNVGHGLWTLRLAGLLDADLDTATERFATAVLANVTDARSVLVDERDDFANNYTAWLNAAGAVAGWLLEGPRGRDAWLDAPHGQYEHVLAATDADGWEWEGATYYHVFVLRAYLLSLRGVDVSAIPAAVRDRLVAMLAVLPAIAAPSGRLPALHDSPYRRAVSDQEILEVAAIGAQLAGLDVLAPVVAAARNSLGAADDGLDANLGVWLHGEPAPAPAEPTRPVTTFVHVGYTVLHGRDGRWRVLLDHGPHGGAHGHLDKLSLYVESEAAWQPDPGITPYASAQRAHYASTLAHPTFRVDGADQRPCSGRLVRYEVDDEGAATVIASADDAYPGVRAIRTLHLAASWLLDVVDLEVLPDGAAPADRELTLQFRPAVAVAVRALGDGFGVRWSDPAGDLCTQHVAEPAGAVCRPVPLPGPADDPAQTVTGIDWTVDGPRARFCTVWQPATEAERDEVVAVRLEDGAAVVTTRTCTTRIALPQAQHPDLATAEHTP